MGSAEREPVRVGYARRNRDLDPQLVWRGKDEQDLDDLIVPAPPLFIQEKVHPKVLVDDLMRLSKDGERRDEYQTDLFADFNGLHDADARTEFYRHEQNWSNRMILGDSLQVMASLSEREGLRGKVQCIYIDPPYGIRFNSNFQWSTTSRDVRDGNARHITREPEQVRAYRDTWRDGIHSYLSYLRDRLTVARDLLTESGSVFVQIGDENVHRVRAVMDEVFGDDNFVSSVCYASSIGLGGSMLDTVTNYVIWYSKSKTNAKYRALFRELVRGSTGATRYNSLTEEPFKDRRLTTEERSGRVSVDDKKCFFRQGLTSRSGGGSTAFPVAFEGKMYRPTAGGWRTSPTGMKRVLRSNRIEVEGQRLTFKKYFGDFGCIAISNFWSDLTGGVASRSDPKVYVVQTSSHIIQRCILMTTDPGDIVLDPTCGAGTTAYVAEQWGRRWITIDTSRVALALARARIMGARYPYYLLADSMEGQRKDAELRRREPSDAPTYENIRQGFVYERVPHITLRDIANNSEIDVIWDDFRQTLEPLREELNFALGQSWEEWEIPRDADDGWDVGVKKVHADWWKGRIARQRELDASIAANAEFEYLYDKPYVARRKVRVAGPFTVESLSPHRVIVAGAKVAESGAGYRYDGDVPERDFAALMLDNLRTSGVQQSQKADKIEFTAVTGWPGKYICAEGRYMEGETERRAGIFIGPEFGTVARADLSAAGREAGETGFDALIACAFSYDAHSTSLNRLGALPILKARMNADLHMAETLKNDSRGNLFVIFGEPDIAVASEEWLVDSLGNRVAPYDIFKLVSGLDSLAEIDGLDSEDLRAYADISCRRAIWDRLTDATGGGIDSGEHRGGTGKADDGGVSTIAWHCARLAGGTGNLSDFVRKAGSDRAGQIRELVERLRRDQQDAARSDANAIRSPLTTAHYSQVEIRGVDIYHPATGQVRSDDTDGIACWFVDTDYNEESFFVRHAYFLGSGDPYKALKTTLKSEINVEAWATLRSDTSRAFPRPASGRIAVKVINHLGDEVMKVVSGIKN